MSYYSDNATKLAATSPPDTQHIISRRDPSRDCRPALFRVFKENSQTFELIVSNRKRQIIENIECPKMLAEHMTGEDLPINALFLYEDRLAAEITKDFNGHHLILAGHLPGQITRAPVAITPIAQSPNLKREIQNVKLKN